MKLYFVPDNSSVFVEPWGGFKRCDAVSDCIIIDGSSTLYSMVMTCAVMEDSPFPGGGVCRCDLGLGGAECTEITTGAVYKLIFMLLGIVVSSIVTCYGLVELYHRGVQATSNPIVLSLR
jgi:hypothetical protein